MDLKSIVKGVECCRMGFCFACPYNDGIEDVKSCQHALATDVLDQLKALEPITPKTITLTDEGVTWQKYDVPVCGHCEALLGDALYCPRCGKKVKWE